MSGSSSPEGGSRSRSGLALVLAIIGGLTLAGSSLASWVQRIRTDDVAGIPVETVEVTLGVELAPLALPLGIAAAVFGFALAVRRELLRRVVGGLLLATGLAAAVVIGFGMVAAAGLEGDLGTGAYVSAAAALLVAVAGGQAVRPAPPPPPALPSRYDIDVVDDDAEWDMASAEDDVRDGGDGA